MSEDRKFWYMEKTQGSTCLRSSKHINRVIMITRKTQKQKTPEPQKNKTKQPPVNIPLSVSGICFHKLQIPNVTIQVESKAQN